MAALIMKNQKSIIRFAKSSFRFFIIQKERDNFFPSYYFLNILKVSFIGLSNWALDPAKTNRGIMVQRGIPDEEDLVESAK